MGPMRQLPALCDSYESYPTGVSSMRQLLALCDSYESYPTVISSMRLLWGLCDSYHSYPTVTKKKKSSMSLLGHRRIQTWGSVIFCKFLVGNSANTEASELRNIDITEFRCLDFSNISLKFLTLRSLKSSRQSRQIEKTCQKESMQKHACVVL